MARHPGVPGGAGRAAGGDMSRRRPMIVPYARHFCRTCDQRVFPFDSLEKRTEAPGQHILLTSLNSRIARRDPDDPARMAWCWVCNGWTETYRETLKDLWRRYERRKGVRYRQGKILQMKRKRRS